MEKIKDILYLDMDGVLADFDQAVHKIDPTFYLGDGDDYDERSVKLDKLVLANKGFFRNLELIPFAKSAVETLKDYYDIYFLSSPMGMVPECGGDKKAWLDQHFGLEFCKKRLILTHRKDLNVGRFLVDDRARNGADKFKGEWIKFGSSKYPDWIETTAYLIEQV